MFNHADPKFKLRSLFRLTATFLLTTSIAATAGAQHAGKNARGGKAAAPAAESPQDSQEHQDESVPPEDKVDVSDLENKYWAAKDSDFSVVQNRLYSKSHRFALSGSVGNMLNDPWSTGTTYAANLGYYFSERWGVELAYVTVESSDNQAVQKLRNQLGYPDHNLIKDYYGMQLNYVPFYAKMSVFNWTIIYFDMSFGLGAGMQGSTQQKEEGSSTVAAPAVTLDITQNFFLNKYISLRVDFKNRWYQEETVKFKAANAALGSGRSNGTSIANTSFLMIGLSLFY